MNRRDRKRAIWRKSAAKYYAAHKQERLAKAKAKNDSSHATIKARQFRSQQRAWAIAHPELVTLIAKARVIAITKRHRSKHVAVIANRRAAQWLRDKAKVAQKHKDWCRANKASVNARNSVRHRRKRAAVPRWANMAEICAIYDVAVRLTMETGIRHEVDHIYPLQSAIVCGLHVPWNLRVVTKSENSRKRNRMPTAEELRRHIFPPQYPCDKAPMPQQPSLLDQAPEMALELDQAQSVA